MKFKGLIINFILLLYLEIILKLVVFKNIFSFNTFYLIIFSFFISLFITILLRVINQKVSKALLHIIWFIISFLFIVEVVYFKYYNTIVGIGGLEYTGQVMGFASSIGQVILTNLHIILLFLVPNVSLIWLKQYIEYDKYKRGEILNLLVIFVVLFFSVTISFLFKNNSNRNILFNKNNLLLSTDRFGLITGINTDIFKIIINFKEDTNIITSEKQEIIETKEYNITDIDFDSLISAEKNETIREMHMYFKSSEATEKNEWTGTFAGKNLIFIVAEAFYPIAINETLTPTLYKLQNEGFNFTNFYQPIYGCSTSDGEFTSLYSLLPGASTCTMKVTKDNYYPYSFGNIFSDDYTKTAFHGGNYKYYSRHLTLPNLGYKYYACGSGLNINCKSWPQSDVETVEDSLRRFIKEDKFLTYYMSISGHLEYNFYGNLIARKNKDLVKDINASNAIKAYMATQIEFDRSLEYLINELRKSGKLDDTVIAIVPDHYPYGLTNNEIENYAGITDTTFELYKNSFILWNSEMKESVKVEKYASNIDVLPTILNLFGIEYDSRLLIGKDILSNSDGIVMFNNFNWINEYGKYNYAKNEFVPNEGVILGKEKIDKINNDIQNKFLMSKFVVLEDYYKYVLRKD